MKPKDKLNLKAVDDLVKTSSFRNLLTLGAKGVQGLGSGMAVGSLIISFLAITGISLALVFEIVAAAGGAAIFGGLALLITGYHLWKRHTKIKELKGKFDTKLSEVRKTLIEVLINYQSTNQLIDELNEMLKQESEDQEKIELLEQKLKQLEEIKAEHIKHLQIALSMVAGDNTAARLSQLFLNVPGDQGQEAIKNYAKDVLSRSEKDMEKINWTLNDIWDKLDHDKDPSEDKLTEIWKLIKLDKEKTHPHIKKVSYALTGVGGFLGGVGATLTITAIAFGGMAALTGIGWPIAVAAIGVGVITMCATLLYYHYVDRKQQTTINRISLATGQAAWINTYLHENVNEGLKNRSTSIKSASSKSSYKNLQHDISSRLSEQETVLKAAMKKMTEKIKVESKAVEEIKSEMNCSKKPNPVDKDRIDELVTSMKISLETLKHTKEMITPIITVAYPEEKTALLATVDEQINTTNRNLKDMEEIRKKNESLHKDKLRAETSAKNQQVKSVSGVLLNFFKRTPAAKPLEKKEDESEGEEKRENEGEGHIKTA